MPASPKSPLSGFSDDFVGSTSDDDYVSAAITSNASASDRTYIYHKSGNRKKRKVEVPVV